MTVKKLLLTFDYELFLGKRSGTVKNCLLKPTALVLDKLKANHCKAVWFIDTVYLIRLAQLCNENTAAAQDFNDISFQLRQLQAEGHAICPHIHPHWLDAVYDAPSNQWSLQNYERYKLSAVQPQEAEALFDQSVEILKNILKNNLYQPLAYRAGGWCIQPFTTFLSSFMKHNIHIDMSVLPGSKVDESSFSFDFSHLPSKPFYRFNASFEPQENGEFIELPISMISTTKTQDVLNRRLNSVLWRIGNSAMGDGASIAKGPSMQSKNGQMVAIELLNAVTWSRYKTYLGSHEWMHFIAHPKMLSKHNILYFDRFLRYSHKKFKIETDLKKISEIYF